MREAPFCKKISVEGIIWYYIILVGHFNRSDFLEKYLFIRFGGQFRNINSTKLWQILHGRNQGESEVQTPHTRTHIFFHMDMYVFAKL